MQRMLGHACAANDVGHLRRSVGASPLVAHHSATPGAKSMRMGGPVRNESHHGPGFSCWSAMFDHRVATRTSCSQSGFLTPSATTMNGAITAGPAEFGGVDIRNMWGMPQLGRWKWHDPDVHVQSLADNNTRLWVFSPATLACSDPTAMIGYCDQAQGS